LLSSISHEIPLKKGIEKEAAGEPPPSKLMF